MLCLRVWGFGIEDFEFGGSDLGFRSFGFGVGLGCRARSLLDLI